MTKNVSMIRKIGGVGLAGAMTLGSAVAMAVDFDATAQVQNALDITVIDQMNLGSIFATTASTTAVGILRMTPAGNMSRIDAASGGPILLGLGGQVPARGSVAVGSTTPFNVTFPNAVTTGTLASVTDADLLTALGAGEGVELQLGGAGGDPTVARLYLVNFSLGAVTSGEVTADNGGAVTTGACDLTSRLVDGDAVECTVTPDFGATAVEFAIGADVVTDIDAARPDYEAGTYTGTFTVEASY